MKKKYYLLLLLFFAVSFFVGCVTEDPGNAGKGTKTETEVGIDVKIINPTGPTVIPVAGIASGNVTGNIDIDVQYWNSMDEVTAAVARDEVQFIIMPVTTGANLYNNDMDIMLTGVHTWKLFYLISNNSSEFSGWESFKGKEIYTPVGKGQTADVIMRAAFHDCGLDPDTDLKIVYAPPQEIVALFKEGKVEYAALPEPFVTLAVQGDGGNVILDFQKFWGEYTGLAERFPITGVFVTKKFYEDYPEVTEEVIGLISKSVDWANNNQSSAIKASSEVLPIPEPVMLSALERIDFTFVPTAECKDEISAFLEKMKELYPDSPAVPDEGFYK
jgi:NitT/TauT family transport system substrate-binding protein